MTSRRCFILAVLQACSSSSSAPASPANPPDTSVPTGEPGFGLDSRPANLTCRPHQPPPRLNRVTLSPAFPNQLFFEPLQLIRQRLEPSDDASFTWFVVEKRGTVRAFTDELASASVVALDISDRVVDISENGLLGVTFDPDYRASPNGIGNANVYLTYIGGTDGGTHDCPTNRDGKRRCGYLSRFEITTSDGGQSFSQGEEQILVRMVHPFEIHRAGQVLFGPDGYLYWSIGDGGSGYDPDCAGQNLNTPLSKILRLDVRSGQAPYGIPPDNPYAGGPLCNNHQYVFATDALANNPDIARSIPCPETFAWGFRNPWRFSFDRLTGAIWAGDVGQDRREEIDLVISGGNYGWNAREGSIGLPPWAHCDNDGSNLLPPAIEYQHLLGRTSVTGGFVYRGSAMPSLVGSYVFTDSGSGEIWAIADPYGLTATLHDPDSAGGGGAALVAMAEDERGELYAVNIYGGLGEAVFRLEETTNQDTTDPLPDLLSATGCVDSANPWLPAPGLIPYDVNSPLWSDGAEKARFLALPDGALIRIGDDGDWDLPVGSVLMKRFSLAGQRLETRFFVRQTPTAWAGYTYVWHTNDDAELADSHLELAVDGASWGVPSPHECFSCHTKAAGVSLGPETQQLNRQYDYGNSRLANQIDTFDHIGLFAASPGASATLPALLDPRAGAGTLEERARSYLHANCSHCHRPGGTGAIATSMNLLASTPFTQTGTCNVPPRQVSDYGIQDPLIIAPGEPERSALYVRLGSTDDILEMPPLARDVVDETALTLVGEWIAGRLDCQPPP
jgi:uncharacterized repeat protein (TIGR03806 family)